MLSKLKCAFGLHKWAVYARDTTVLIDGKVRKGILFESCDKCGKIRYIR